MTRKITPQGATIAKHRRRRCLVLVLALLSMMGSGCAGEQKPAKPATIIKPSAIKPGPIGGKIIVDIVEPGEVHNMFLVLPKQETITRVTGSTKTESKGAKSPTGAIQGCHSNPTSVSPDQKFVGGCQGEAVALLSGSPPDRFILGRKGGNAIILERVLGPQISGFLWSPDSQAVAVLTCTVHVSWNPRYWFEALSTHPKQYETYDLHVVDVVNLSVTSYNVPLEASLSTGGIVSWR